MKNLTIAFALAAAFAVATSPVAFAQAGGSDVPTDAAKQGVKENGASSTGGKGAMKSGGSMTKKHTKKKSM